MKKGRDRKPLVRPVFLIVAGIMLLLIALSILVPRCVVEKKYQEHFRRIERKEKRRLLLILNHNQATSFNVGMKRAALT